jgi:hypothetical protein
MLGKQRHYPGSKERDYDLPCNVPGALLQPVYGLAHLQLVHRKLNH